MSSTAEDLNKQMPAMAPVKGGVTPYLSVKNASAAAEFYKRAFAAVEVARHPVDEQGRTMHIHLYINDSSVMLSDFYPDYGHAFEAPAAFNLTIHSKDIDAEWERAVAAGAEVVLPLQVMFWGDRYGQLRDPYGVMWSLNQPTK